MTKNNDNTGSHLLGAGGLGFIKLIIIVEPPVRLSPKTAVNCHQLRSEIMQISWEIFCDIQKTKFKMN